MMSVEDLTAAIEAELQRLGDVDVADWQIERAAQLLMAPGAGALGGPSDPGSTMR